MIQENDRLFRKLPLLGPPLSLPEVIIIVGPGRIIETERIGLNAAQLLLVSRLYHVNQHGGGPELGPHLAELGGQGVEGQLFLVNVLEGGCAAAPSSSPVGYTVCLYVDLLIVVYVMCWLYSCFVVLFVYMLFFWLFVVMCLLYICCVVLFVDVCVCWLSFMLFDCCIVVLCLFIVLCLGSVSLRPAPSPRSMESYHVILYHIISYHIIV